MDQTTGYVISAEAEAALTEPRMEIPVFTAGNLPRLRAEGAAFYAPRAARMLTATGTVTEETVLAGVPCLVAVPPGPAAPWSILYGYGGGFVAGSPEEDLVVAAALAAGTGARVVIPRYRLAPEAPWPAAIDDGFAVYRAMAGAPFALVGESAGGNLALALLHRARAAGVAFPRALALMSPWADLTHGGDSLSANDGRDPTIGRAHVVAAADLYAQGADRRNPDLSPLFGRFDGFPPTMITTGTRDLLLSHAVRTARALQEAAVPTDLRVWDGLWHVFEFDDRLPEAAESIAGLAAFVTRHMIGT